MSNIFDLEPNGSTPTSTDPILAAATGGTELIDQFRFASATSASEENLAIALGGENSPDDILLPQNGPPPLLESQANSSGPQISEPKDSLTGEETRASIQPRNFGFYSYDSAGNNRRNAYIFGTITGTETFSDSVSSSDRKDFFKFSIDEKSKVNISISGLSDDTDLYLRNRRGKIITKSIRGSDSEEISRLLRHGDYYVEVRAAYSWTSSNYDLEVKVTSDNAGNNRRNARELGTITDTTSNYFEDFVGRGDRKDFYTFTLANESDVSISLDDLSGNANLHLFKQGTRGAIARSTNRGSSDEAIDKTLDDGTYYLQIKSVGGGGTNYDLSFDVEESDLINIPPPPPPPPPEPPPEPPIFF